MPAKASPRAVLIGLDVTKSILAVPTRNQLS
jgi:hypothetical protein